MWTPEFACPECRLPCHLEPPDGFACSACKRLFPYSDGIYRFLTPQRKAAAAPFEEQYRVVRLRDGHRFDRIERLRALPDVPPADANAGEWSIRKASLARLMGIAASDARVLDLGAGCGWLSHRFAATGRRAVAVDRFDDDIDGLGAARRFDVPFAAVQADFDALPFTAGQFDLVVLNASLHYAPDPSSTLAHAREMLAAGGSLAVMDSPMFTHDSAGQAMVAAQRRTSWTVNGEDGAAAIQPGFGFLTFDLLERAAAALDLRARFYPSRGPLGWRLQRQVGRFRLGRAPAAFGVWVAR
jgi:SAM-dependent methyltransferase